MLRERIEARARGLLGRELEEEIWSKLEVLGELWLRYGAPLGLSGARTPDELGEHVLEGLQAVACAARAGIDPANSWLDVGSGGGFPGLVVAATRPGQVVLVEPRERRAVFLNMGLMAIERHDCAVYRARLEGSTWEQIVVGEELKPLNATFTIVSARSVFSPARWLESGMKLVSGGGVLLLHLGVSDPDPDGVNLRARVDGQRWSVRGYDRGS